MAHNTYSLKNLKLTSDDSLTMEIVKTHIQKKFQGRRSSSRVGKDSVLGRYYSCPVRYIKHHGFLHYPSFLFFGLFKRTKCY